MKSFVEHEALAKRMAKTFIDANYAHNKAKAINVVVRTHRPDVKNGVWNPNTLKELIKETWRGLTIYPPTHLLDDVFTKLGAIDEG